MLKLNINVKKWGHLRILLRKKFCFTAFSSNFAENETRSIMTKSPNEISDTSPRAKASKELKPLTKAEAEVMNVLWNHAQGMTTNDIVESYDTPKPAYSTIATFLRILEAKGFVEHKRENGSGRTFIFSPMLTREKYVTQVLNNVKDTVLGKSNKNLFSFFVQNEELSDEELQEILEIIQNKIHPAL